MTELGLVPQDVALRETLAFLDRFAPPQKLRVLEVGCGRGALALRLSKYGWDVTAIDPDAEAVEVARQAGVQAWPIGLLEFESTPFDAVIVARALHHIGALADAVKHLAELVRPGGWLFCDEFSIEEAGEGEARWVYERRDLLEEAGVLSPRGPRLELVNAMDRWRAEHADPEHPLQLGAAMREAIEDHFEVLFTERAPYLYRYLVEELEASARGHRLAQLLLEQERMRIDADTLRPLGLRIAARRPEAVATK